MTEMLDQPAVLTLGSGRSSDNIIRNALQESRQRWRHLVGMAADMAFETDDKGRFVFVTPDAALGWPEGGLIGQPSELLVGTDGSGGTFNPFRPTTEIRRHLTWLRRFDGSMARMSISAAPLHDASGRLTGARGVGVDTTESETQTEQIAGRLRRGEVIEHILSRVGQEQTADGMMDAALWAVIHALGAEGAAVIGSVSDDAAPEVLHECGSGAVSILEAAVRVMADQGIEPADTVNFDGRLILAIGLQTRFSTHAGLAIWRADSTQGWAQEDLALAGSAVSIVRMILEYEAVQQKLVRQARVDPLTGRYNRRAFRQEVRRHMARLERESQPGTLMYIDLDSFTMVNDRLGRATGDKVLIHFGEMLQKLVRSFDVVARLSGDIFAVWLSGADHMAAAERADDLCKAVPQELQTILPEGFPALGVSIGLATWRVGSLESVDDLMKRADLAMFEVKRGGRGHWRVAMLNGEP
jgi:diguanylate cyclase (GGDEF)-like protein/PAS domain S-box-containing protein